LDGTRVEVVDKQSIAEPREVPGHGRTHRAKADEANGLGRSYG
jgi:hypothetical protein